MALLRSSSGIRLNATNNVNSNFGCLKHESTRTWNAYQSGINMFQIYQNGATSITEVVAINLFWSAVRTNGNKVEIPALFAIARLHLNVNGEISVPSYDWQVWGGNGILWPYVAMGGTSCFIGANNGMDTGVTGSVIIDICTNAWGNLVVNAFSD